MENEKENGKAGRSRRILEDNDDVGTGGRLSDAGLRQMEDTELREAEIEGKWEPGRGFHKYNTALKTLIPIRRKPKDKEAIPMDNAGLISSISFSWISKFMYRTYRHGITPEDLPAISPYDTCVYNTDRLELLWEEELARKGPKKASFPRVAWRFCRTRIYVSCFVFTCSLLFGFLSPTLLMRKLLEHVQSGDRSFTEGMQWALLLTASEFTRTLLFAWTWGINYRTAVRLRSACLTLVYRKIIRVNNLGDKGIGEVINIFSNDAQRIFDVILLGSMIVGGPVTMIAGVFYILWLLSPIALLGMAAFLLFYPIQYLISYVTGYLRSRAVKASDMRVRLMNEILECIKVIKMYAWEKPFSQDLQAVRKKEEALILKTSYCQSFSVSMAPIIPVVSSIITFLAHVSAGNNLTAAEAFPLSTFFGNHIKQALTRLRDVSQAIADSLVAFRRIKVFPYVSFVSSQLRLSLSHFEYAIEAIISANISFSRIKSILLLEDGNCAISKPIIKTQAVAINRGTFACNTYGNPDKGNSPSNHNTRETEPKSSEEDQSEKEKLNEPANRDEHIDILFDVTFEAAKGKLIGICGHVGSGKSSLLLAALGQLRVTNGQVLRDGSCAYVTQQAWITNASLRDNILFGEEYDHSRYHKAIYACSLDHDISILPGGDRTEIGERGINLSGGQKQRVALARALYADRDIYFLDDPLSAVDARVGAYIFDNLILGALGGKTVLFVTHQIQYLSRCDDIYMMRDGRIIEHGGHEELMNLGSEYSLMVTAVLANNETDNGTLTVDKTHTPVNSFDAIATNESGRSRTTSACSSDISDQNEKTAVTEAPLTVADNLQKGSIKAHTYHAYIVAAGGYILTFVVIFCFFVSIGSITFSSWWLAEWIKAGGGNATMVRDNVTMPSVNINDNPNFSWYRSIYGIMLVIVLVSGLFRCYIFTRATIGASTTLHNKLFEKIIQSPMRFFETTPSGRIQHLFSRDIDEVDNRLPITLTSILQNLFLVFFSILVICVIFPWFIFALCVLATVFYFVSKIFSAAIRDLKRLENMSRAPIISFVTASVQGLSTIHAFGKESSFMKKFTGMFDENSENLFLCNVAMRWLAVRVDCLSVLITGITAFLVIVFQGQVAPAIAGLALSYSANMSGVFQYTIRLISETEVRFISVEKINHYLRSIEREGGTCKPTIKPRATWPAEAEIKFTDVNMSYGEGSPLVLKNVSFTISPGEKVGIVGRTGSGKSSLTVALLRLVELAKGKIEIDGVDISQLTLEQLRTKLSIIPQDPILFSGSIRSNLDPFKFYTDAEIWQALEKTKLKSRVQSISGNLDASVGFGGDNLSVGERQLLCLSRALLRNCKILVLDEATAAVDPETEIAVQNTIQQEFSDCTILTIAHRLQTVLSLNRVLVMDNGKVREFDTPSNLLENKCSELSKMVVAADRTY